MDNVHERPLVGEGAPLPEGEPATIIAGRVPTQEAGEHIREAMIAEGVPADQIHCFWSNPPGQHNITPIGGDRMADPAAESATSTVVTGAAGGGTLGAVAGAVGVAATGIDPVLGIAVATAIGAHVGGLVGALSGLKDTDGVTEADESLGARPEASSDVAGSPAGMPVQAAPDAPAPAPVPTDEPRQAGVVISVKVGTWDETRIVERLALAGVEDIEHAQGHWSRGQWSDFDPRDPPRKI